MRHTLFALLVVALAAIPACARKPQPHIVLYSSVDAGVIKPILDGYTRRTGVRVDLVTDTEATKTTGLVQRLITEIDRPRADVWWSGETVGTVQLARAGALAPYTSLAAEATARASSLPAWPVRDPRGVWYGLALRPRIIVFNTGAYPARDTAPRSIAALAGSARPVAIANPAFGTARGHLAALYLHLGRDAFTELMSTVRWRTYDGNAAVVRAVASGECDAGLTDYDDYHAGLANSWPLGCSFIGFTPDAAQQVIAIPGTVALVAGAPHPELARAFIDEVLSVATEQALATGDWCAMPVLGSVQTPGDRYKGLTPATIDWEKAADFLEQTADAWAEALKKKN